HFLRDLVDRDVDAAVDEAEHRDRLFIRNEAPIGRDALLILAGAILDRKHDLAAEYAAFFVEVVDRGLAAALDLLPERRLAGWRERREHDENDRFLRESRRCGRRERGHDRSKQSPSV